MIHLTQLAALTLGAMLATGAGAQAVYRCGNTYSHKPCPDAKAIEADDSRSAEQRAEAKRLAADEKHQGRQMERERVAQERATKPALATGFDSRAKKPEPAAASLFIQPKPKKRRYMPMRDSKGDEFIAVAPAAKKKRAEK